MADQTRIQSHYSVTSELQSLSKEEIHGDIRITEKSAIRQIELPTSLHISSLEDCSKKFWTKKLYCANLARYQNLTANARLAVNIQRYYDIFWMQLILNFFHTIAKSIMQEVEQKTFQFFQYILYMSYQ